MRRGKLKDLMPFPLSRPSESSIGTEGKHGDTQEAARPAAKSLSLVNALISLGRAKRMSSAICGFCVVLHGFKSSGTSVTQGGQRQGAVSSGKPPMLRVPTTSQPNGHLVGSGGNRPSLTFAVGLGRILSHET